MRNGKSEHSQQFQATRPVRMHFEYAFLYQQTSNSNNKAEWTNNKQHIIKFRVIYWNFIQNKYETC